MALKKRFRPHATAGQATEEFAATWSMLVSIVVVMWDEKVVLVKMVSGITE